MNANKIETIRSFVQAIREQSDRDCVLFQLEITSEGYEVTEKKRDLMELERQGIAMRNIAGMWVVSS